MITFIYLVGCLFGWFGFGWAIIATLFVDYLMNED